MHYKYVGWIVELFSHDFQNISAETEVWTDMKERDTEVEPLNVP